MNLITRRAVLGGTIALTGTPWRVQAQGPKVPGVGFLATGRDHPAFPAFVEALRSLGWVEGQNVRLQPRFAEPGRAEAFTPLVADLIQHRVDVIVALIHPEIAAAQRATATIPIVMVIGVDPVGLGFARSLARPGGNITGLTWDADPEFNTKGVELLKLLLPRLKRISGLVDPAMPTVAGWDAVRRGATRLDIEVSEINVRAPDEIDKAFVTARERRSDAVFVMGGSMLFGQRVQIARIALKMRVPVMSLYREAVEAGGLISYGPSVPDLWRRSASYVDKILRGARPGDLPIERPTKFELVINLKTAKALGLTIPTSLLARADQVIE